MASDTVRLTEEFRGNKPGSVIHAAPGLARFLVAQGKAEPCQSASPQPCVERAVVPPGRPA